jgi:hypothetical protein
MAEWIATLAIWKNFITLTFENEVSPDSAVKKWKWLVQTLNKEKFGKNYTRKVGHSYFSYILAMEKQTRGVIHFHSLIHTSIEYKTVHKFWSKYCGFAWCEQTKEHKKVIEYITKYMCKGGEIIPFLTTYKGDVSIQSEIFDRLE